MPALNESIVENAALSWFCELGYATLRRETKSPRPPARYSRQFSRQSVVSDGVPNQAIPAVSGHFVRMTRNLMQVGMLESTGGRGAVYHLPGETIPTPDDVFGPPAKISVASSPDLDVGARKVSASSPILAASLPNLARSLPNLESISPNLEEKRDANGCLMADLLALPIIDDLSSISSSLRTRLEEMAVEPRTKRKIGRDPLRAVILQLCAQHFVTLRCLATLVNRKPGTLRDQYLNQLVRERKLTLAFPTTPTHERQAYCASSTLSA